MLVCSIKVTIYPSLIMHIHHTTCSAEPLVHQSFVTTASPHTQLWGWVGDSGANVQGSDLLNSPQCRVSAGLTILRK